MTEVSSIKLSELVGGCGTYQIALIMINFSAATFTGYMRVIIELLAPMVSFYWDWEASNPNKTIFKSTTCKMSEVLHYNMTSNFSNSSSKLIFESQYSSRTITEELDLICDRSWLVSFTNTMILIGSCLGGFLSSRLSEIYGRTRCTIWISLVCLIANILMLFSQGYVMFSLAAMVYGAASTNMQYYIFFQILEILPSSWCDYAGVFSKTGSLFGQSLLVGTAWLLENWFYTQVVHTVLAAVNLLCLFYALESPAWLAVRGRYKEAESVLKRIIVRNGLDPEAAKPRIESYLQEMKQRCEIQSTAEKGKFTDLFKNRVMAYYTFALNACRGLLCFMYLSLIMNAESFGSGLYMDLTISNALAFACFIATTALLKFFSLRTQQTFLCFCGGFICALYPFLYKIPVARSAIIILGRCFISPVNNMLIVYSNQIIPTSVRGVFTGFGVSAAAFISAVSPFSKELGEMTAAYVPFIFLSACGLISAGLFITLPETRGKELVHTVDELVPKKSGKPSAVSRIFRNKICKPNAVYTISSRL